MKKFFLQLLAFSFFLIIYLCAGIITWGILAPYALKKNLVYSPASYGHMFSRIKDVSATKNVDILFIGSSTCYRGFDTRILSKNGYSSFNLGSSNQSHLQSEVLLKQYLPALRPRLVVYEVSPLVLGTDGVESALDLISNDKIDASFLPMALRINNIKVYNSLIFAYAMQLAGTKENITEPTYRESSTYIKGGFEERPIRYFKNDSLFVSIDYVLKETQQKAFQRNLKLLKNQHTPFILVQAPNTKAVYSNIKNTRQIDSLYYASGTYFNFNMADGFKDTLHFYDSGHLNQDGVILFNQKLIALLRQLNFK